MVVLPQHCIEGGVVFGQTCRFGWSLHKESTGAGARDASPGRVPGELPSELEGVVPTIVAQCSAPTVVLVGFNHLLLGDRTAEVRGDRNRCEGRISHRWKVPGVMIRAVGEWDNY